MYGEMPRQREVVVRRNRYDSGQDETVKFSYELYSLGIRIAGGS